MLLGPTILVSFWHWEEAVDGLLFTVSRRQRKVEQEAGSWRGLVGGMGSRFDRMVYAWTVVEWEAVVWTVGGMGSRFVAMGGQFRPWPAVEWEAFLGHGLLVD